MFLPIPRKLIAGALVASVAILAPIMANADTSIKPYLVPLGDEYEIKALLSVGDTVPETSDPSLKYQMVGIPDGMGAHRNGNGTTALYVNHEFQVGVLSAPVVGGPLNRGALVSKFILDEDGDVLSGERAYDRVYAENTPVGPAPEEGNSTPAFARFCSGYLAGPQVGFDRYIYLAGEESEENHATPALETFSGLGGEAVAIFNNELHTLPRIGRYAKENVIVMPDTGSRTVIIGLEDGPSTPDSQLYMYVGRKMNGGGVLARNGLDNGTLYVFAGLNSNKNDETSFQEGATVGAWVEIPDAQDMTDEELEAYSDAVGAFGFIRIEDGAFSKRSNRDMFFVTTGGNKALGNELGRLYHLRLNASNVLKPAFLKVVYNADKVIAAGGDVAISPDNIDTSADYLMIQEDGTTPSRLVMAEKGRDGSIWRFDLKHSNGRTRVEAASAVRVAELDPPGRDGVAVGAGVWESSGIIDTSAMFGADSWLTDVQAHLPTTAPAPNTVEDGQILLMRPK